MASVDWETLRKQAESEGEGFGEILPAGTYETVVTKATARKSSGGKDQIMAQFTVTSGPNKGYSGLFNYFTLSPESAKAVGILVRQLTSLGADLSGELDFTDTARQITGAAATVEVTEDSYNGEARNKITNVKGSTTGSTTTTSATEGFAF